MKKLLVIMLSLFICFNSMLTINVEAELVEPTTAFKLGLTQEGDIKIEIPEEFKDTSAGIVYQGIRLTAINGEDVDCWFNLPKEDGNSNGDNSNYFNFDDNNDLIYSVQKQKDFILWNNNVSRVLVNGDTLSLSLQWGYPNGDNTYYEEYDLGEVTLTNANKELSFSDNFELSFTKSESGEHYYRDAYITIKSKTEIGDEVLEKLINRNGDSDAYNYRYISVIPCANDSRISNHRKYDANKTENNNIVISTYNSGNDVMRKQVKFNKNCTYGLTSNEIQLAIRVPGYKVSNYSSKLDIADGTCVVPSDINFTYDNTDNGKVFYVTATNSSDFLNSFNIELKNEYTVTNPFGNESTNSVEVRLERCLFSHSDASSTDEDTVYTDPNKTVTIPDGKYEYKIYYQNAVVKSGSMTFDDGVDLPTCSIEVVNSTTEGKKDFVISSNSTDAIKGMTHFNLYDMNGNQNFEIQLSKNEQKNEISSLINSDGKLVINYDFYKDRYPSPKNAWYGADINTEIQIKEDVEEQDHSYTKYYSNLYIHCSAYQYIDSVSDKISFPNFDSRVTKGTKIKDAIMVLPKSWEVWYEGDVTQDTRINDQIQLKIAYKAYQVGSNPTKYIDNSDNGNSLRTEEKDGYVYFVGTAYFTVGDIWSAVADEPETINLWQNEARLKGTNKIVDYSNFDSVLEAAIDHLNADSTGTIRLQENIAVNHNIKLYHKFSEFDYNEGEYVDALVIDLNGKTLTLGSYSLVVDSTNNTNVIVIKNGNIVGNSMSLLNIVSNMSIVVLNNVTLTNNSTDINSDVIYGNSGWLRTKGNVTLNSNGIGIYSEKNLVFREWNQDFAYDVFRFNGVIDINSVNDCICYCDPDDTDDSYECEIYECVVGDWQDSSLISHLNSTEGYAVYSATKGGKNFGLNLVNAVVQSKYGIYVEKGNVDIQSSKLTNEVGSAITVNPKYTGNIWCDSTSIHTESSVVKNINPQGPKYAYSFYGCSVHQQDDINPFEVDINNLETDYNLFNKNVSSYLPSGLLTTYIFKDLFRNEYDPEEVFDFGTETHMYFIRIYIEEGEEYGGYRVVNNKEDFIKALTDNEVNGIDLVDQEGNTLDFEDSTVNITSNKGINLNGAKLKNINFVIGDLNSNDATNVQLFGTTKNGKAAIDGSFVVKNANLGIFGIDITGKTDKYVIDCEGYVWIELNDGSVINGDKGIHFSNTPNSNDSGGIGFWNKTKLNVNDEAILVEDDANVYISTDEDSSITSNGKGIIINSNKGNDYTTNLELSGEIIAGQEAIILNKADAYLRVRRGSISGKNAINIATALFHSTGIEISGGKFEGTEDTIKQTGVFAAGYCYDNTFLYVTGGKFKCGAENQYKIFNCSTVNKVRVYGGQFNKDLGSEFVYIKQNIDKTKTYTYKSVQIAKSGTYQYAMARKLPLTSGDDTYNVMDAVSIGTDVIVDADSLAGIASGTSEGTSVVMKVNEQDDVDIIAEFEYDENQELVGTYDIGIVKKTDDLNEVTETNEYQVVAIAAGGIDRDSFRIYHKHENNKPVSINQVTQTEGENRLENQEQYNDAFYYFAFNEELEEWMIYIATKQFSTFAFTQNIVYDAAYCDAPARKLGLVENGTRQNLIEEATGVVGGHVEYSLDGVNWTNEVPTGIGAKEYTVFYKVVGNTTHSDSEIKQIKVSILEDTNKNSKRKYNSSSSVYSVVNTETK